MPPTTKDLITLLSTIVALVSGVGAVLAWVSKIRWAAEYKEAKDATIESKEAQISQLKQQIETLNELTPLKLQQHHQAVIAELNALRQQLEKRVQDLHRELDERDRKIRALEASGNADKSELDKLRSERETLKKKSSEFEVKIQDFGKTFPSLRFPAKFPTIDLEGIEADAESLNGLSSVQIDLDIFKDLSKRMKKSPFVPIITAWKLDPDTDEFKPR